MEKNHPHNAGILYVHLPIERLHKIWTILTLKISHHQIEVNLTYNATGIIGFY